MSTGLKSNQHLQFMLCKKIEKKNVPGVANNNEKCARGGNKKEKDVRSVIKTKSKLIGLGTPLIIPELLDWSLSFANV